MFNAMSWRKQPYVSRRVYNEEETGVFCESLYRLWLVKLPHVRAFVDRDTNGSSNIPYSRLIPQKAAVDIFSKLQAAGEPFTFLLNDVDTVYDDVLRLRNSLGVPYQWRVDDVVATYSSPGSGIGYHAGHEDAFIFQANGRRRWRVWSNDEVPTPLRKRILLSAGDDLYSFPNPTTEPILDCILEEGDVLYIPAFCPHEGVTLDESISVAYGWKGICYYHLAAAFNPEFVEGAIENLPDELFGLVEDFDAQNRDVTMSAIAGTVAQTLGHSHRDANVQNRIVDSVIRLMSWDDRVVSQNDAVSLGEC